jgi:cytochrome c
MKYSAFCLALGLWCLGTDVACADLGLLKRGCGVCHGTDTRLNGPSFKEIAVRFKGGKDAERLLAEKIRAGSKGQWGATGNMPPNPRISPLEARKLANWVLGF